MQVGMAKTRNAKILSSHRFQIFG